MPGCKHLKVDPGKQAPYPGFHAHRLRALSPAVQREHAIECLSPPAFCQSALVSSAPLATLHSPGRPSCVTTAMCGDVFRTTLLPRSPSKWPGPECGGNAQLLSCPRSPRSPASVCTVDYSKCVYMCLCLCSLAHRPRVRGTAGLTGCWPSGGRDN